MDPKFQRSMGLFSVIAMVVGLQLGSAMFLLPGQMVDYGGWGVLSWVIAGIGALSLCQVFAELAHQTPQARGGGPHVYIGNIFGKRAAFYAAWSYWIISWLSSVPVLAMSLNAAESFLGTHLPPLSRFFVALFVTLSVVTLNLRGTKASGKAELALSSLKVGPMILIPLAALPFWSWDALVVPSQMPPLQALAEASMLTFWGFVGLEGATTIAHYVPNAQKILPKALFLGTGLVLFIYMINTISVMSILPPQVLKSVTGNPYGQILETILGAQWGRWIAKGLSFLIFIMGFGTLNSWVLSASAMAQEASQQGLFPGIFSRQNTSGSPWFATISSQMACTLVFGLSLCKKELSQSIHVLVNISNITFILIYGWALVSLFYHLQHKGRGKKIKISSLLAMITAGLFCLWSIWSAGLILLMGSLMIPLSGFLLARFFLWPIK